MSEQQNEPGKDLGKPNRRDALKLGGGQWRPHDLRRTGASAMAELGALPDVIEKMATFGALPAGGAPEVLGKTNATEHEQMGKLIKELGVTAE